MKRLLAFLALFGLGLAGLLWYQRRSERAVPDGGRGEAPAPSQDAGAVALQPDQPVPPGSGLILRGPLRVQHFRERSATEKVVNALLTTADTHTLPGGAIEGRGVHVELYDDLGIERQATIDAPRALLPIDPDSAGLVPRLGDHLTLFDPTISIESGVSFAPLTCTADELECDLEARALAAAGPARVEARALAVSGRGLHLRIGSRSIGFASDARAETELAGERLALSSEGPLSVEEPLDAPGGLRIRAESGVRLSSSGARPWTLGGDACAIDAVRAAGPGDPVDPGGAGALRLAALAVEGRAVLEISGATVEGQRANALVGPDGRLTELAVEGAPRARMPASLLGAALAELGDVEAALSGTGPLRIALGAGALPALRMSGPARLEFGAAVLAAAQEIRLSGDPPKLTAIGAVTLERGGELLEAPEIELAGGIDGGIDGRLLARTAGPARLASAGAGFALETTGALELAGAGAAWTVPLALGVSLEVGGRSPWSARAERVTGFVPEPLAFVAAGNVDFASPDGRGGGDELTVRGPEDLELVGRPDALAWFDGPLGHATARRIVRSGELLRAEGSVAATLRQMKLSAQIDADELEFRLGDQTGPGGTQVRTFSFDARATGAAPLVAQLDQEDGASEFECRSLVGTRTERWLAGAMLSATTELRALEVPRAIIEQDSDQWQLSARVIDARAVYQEELTRAGLDARGDVRFERQGLRGTAAGRGERLTVDVDRRGRLEPLPGARVAMSGRLAGSAHEYELDADALDFTEEYLEASNPVLTLRRVAGAETAPDDVEDRLALDSLRASGRWLSAVGDEVELDGAARFEGRLSDGTEWTLQSERAEARIDAGAARGMDQLAALAAHENVLFRLGASVRAAGHEFSFQGAKRVLRVEGRAGGDARVEIAGLAWESAWLEFDLAIRSIRTGPGRAWPLASALAEAAAGGAAGPEARTGANAEASTGGGR